MYFPVGPVSVLVNLAVADAGIAPGPLQPGAETADAGEHVEKFNGNFGNSFRCHRLVSFLWLKYYWYIVGFWNSAAAVSGLWLSHTYSRRIADVILPDNYSLSFISSCIFLNRTNISSAFLAVSGSLRSAALQMIPSMASAR